MEEPRPYRQSSRKFARARRGFMTKGEEIVWRIVRNSRLGVPFRRQMPIGPYFADFACPSARLIVEIDGRTHEDPEAREKDRVRQARLEKQGWRVLRFKDDLVIGGAQLVSDAIRQALAGIGESDE